MRAAGRTYVPGKWQPIRRECRLDRLPLLNEAGNTFLHILSPTINISPFHHPITPFLPSFSSLFSSSTHYPSLSLFFYGWVVLFPWDSGGGELSRTRCFIITNKAGNKFRPPHLGFSDETLRQKPFFLLLCNTFLLMYVVMFYTCSLYRSWHYFLSSFIFFCHFHWLYFFLFYSCCNL